MQGGGLPRTWYRGISLNGTCRGTRRPWLRTFRLDGRIISQHRGTGITGAHLLHQDTSIVRPDSKEREARQRADGSSDVVLLIEGYDPNAISAVAKESPAISKPVVQIDLYQVAQAAYAEDSK